MSTCLIIAIVCAVLAVPAIGVMAALGIYGTRRYVAAAKTAEAKNTVSAIARAAQAAYERDLAEHGKDAKLCGSATPVPRTGPPPGNKYMPSAMSGADFNSGSAKAGWMCLKFSVTTPMYYQYHYNTGSGWVVPAQAPGANGFEAAAVGDLDGNGTHSKFTRTGTVSGGTVMVNTNIYVENEFE
jgi:type IV pilus assembly protein PilA